MSDTYETDQDEGQDAGDAADVKEKRKEAKRKADRKREAVRAFMSSAPGREWFFDLLVRTGVYSNPFSKGQPDLTAFNCGEMNIGQIVLADVEGASPELYMQMMKENQNAN